jgi:hypothetical protein
LIQADFILQASREEVIADSAWNKAILDHVAKAFCNAVLDFCRGNSLRLHWMRFLPVGGAQGMNPLWRKLSSDVIDLLEHQRILYPHDHNHFNLERLSRPECLRTLPTNYLDRNGSPLFVDRPGDDRKYLSLCYGSEDINILKRAFRIEHIEDIHMFHRIKQDLDSPISRMKHAGTDADWHSRAADLITSILERSRDVARMMEDILDLIPLSDGRWVRALAGDLFLPSRNGPTIPQDLVVTIHPEAVRNVSRKNLFTHLGATECPPERVINQLWTSYLQYDGASTLAASKAHLSYLYWHYADMHNARFSRLWLYDSRLTRVTSRQRVIYLPSDDEYGPRELLKAVPDHGIPRRFIPECLVPYVNAEYMELFPSSAQRHGLSWLDWLQTVLGVRRVPRLKYDAGSLSAEFRHIIQYRPEKIIGTLKVHWATYRREMNNGIEGEISRAEVTCVDAPPAVLSFTYFPLRCLTQKARELGIIRGFPFLNVPGLSEEDRASEEDWGFLRRFGVRFVADLTFYLDILRQHEARRHQSWNGGTRNGILKTYELIADHYNEVDRAMLL